MVGSTELQTGFFRNIVELSDMSNNDEHVFYTADRLRFEDKETLEKVFPPRPFKNPRLILSRPVFNIEIEKGLKTVIGVVYDSMSVRPPEETLFFDAIFQIKGAVDVVKSWPKEWNPSEFLATYIGNRFYDCMSGGMSRVELSILYHLCKNPLIDQEVDVYPDKENEAWTKIKDFIKEVEEHHQKAVVKPLLIDSATKLLTF
jgi:hypothetical protein